MRLSPRLVAPLLPALVLASCQMEIGVGTKLNRDGSGTFTLAVAADKEFVDGLSQDPSKGGLGVPGGFRAFEDLFEALERSGWRVRRAQTPGGDVALTGACDFARTAEIDRCLGQLSASGGTDGVRFRDTGLTFDVGQDRGLFKTRSFIAGSVNLAGPQISSDPRVAQQLAELQAFASQVFRFEVRAELPGSPRIVAGAEVASIKDGVVAWRPRIGERLDFRATSDAYNPTALTLVAVLLVIVLGAGVWLVTRRRTPPPEETGFVSPADVMSSEEVTT